MDGQPNDRLGREEQWHRLKHRRKILRSLSEPNTDANSESYADPDCYRNSNAHRKPDADPPCIDDTWTSTNTTNAPSARTGHTAVWTGSEMIVWGGQNDIGD